METCLPIQNNIASKRIILIHGMWMNGFSMRFIGHQLKKKGWQVSYYDYSSMFTPFEQNVEGLYALWQSFQSDQVRLVAHSLGGLLVLEMMKKYHLTNLPRTVLMGCPINGSAVAKKILSNKLGKAALGKSGKVLLSGVSCTQSNQFGIIIGSKGLGVGHLIQKIPKPHDGVVAFDEADTNCAEDKIILPLTHASMLISRKTSGAIDRYLSVGKF